MPCNALKFYYVFKKIRKSSSFGGKDQIFTIKGTKQRIYIYIRVMNQLFQKLKQFDE